MQNFKELNLSAPIMKSIEEMGFTTPTPIQAQALPILLGPTTDFLGLAATGTGKTATYSIPMLEKIDSKLKAVQSLILCPTRELALQVAGQVELLGKHMGVRSVCIYGGAPYADQIYGLKSGASVVVGTPGRVVDHISRGTLKLDQVKVLILDEADEMISMGFAEDMEKVMGAIKERDSEAIANTWLFSATMNAQVSRVAKTYLKAPQQVQVNRTEVLSTTVEQFYYPVHESDKPEILCKLIDAAEDFYGVIFCQTKALVSDLAQLLQNRGYRVDSLHGDKDQKSREKTLQAFRDRKVRILICTDVAARGIDVKDITHVINYSLPRELDNYVHRIGRTARSGKTGIAMNLVTPSHRRLIFEIERFTKSRMMEGVIPTRKEIGSKKVSQLLPKFSDQPFAARAVEVLSPEWKESLVGLTVEEVAGRFLTMMLPDLFNERERKATVAPPRESNRRPTGPRQRDYSGARERNYSRDRRDSRDGAPRGDRREDSGFRREFAPASGSSAPRRFERRSEGGRREDGGGRSENRAPGSRSGGYGQSGRPAPGKGRATGRRPSREGSARSY